MWTHDIGRHEASGHGLLKVIFEVNLKLFQQESSRKILFVLRDFADSPGNFEKFKKILERDIDTIWNDIYKPEKHKNSKATDFFKFEHAFMPHKVYAEEKFIAKAAELKSRFVVGSGDSLFLSEAEQKNLPLDGFPLFIE